MVSSAHPFRILGMAKIMSLQVTDETAERLRRLAQEADRSVSSELRRAVRQHLAQAEQEEAERLAALYQQAVQETGE